MEYKAILIDTQTIDNYRWRFDEGMLAKLHQFKDTDVRVLIPDIIKNEVTSHLAKKINTVQIEFEKAIKTSEEEFLIAKVECEKFRKEYIDIVDSSVLAQERIESFIESCGATEFECGEYIGLSEVFKAYFELTPPFKNKETRKREFPDASILFATEEYASDEDLYVIAVSRDEGWVDYCSKSKRIKSVKDLGEAISLFQPKTAPHAFALKLIEGIRDNTAAEFINDLEQQVISKYDFVDVQARADSYLSHEIDDLSCFVSSVEFDDEVNVIEVGDGWATFDMKVNVKFEAQCSVSFSHYDSIDRDSVYIGSTEAQAEKYIETGLIVTLVGDFFKGYDEIDVDEIALESVIKSIYFGEVEPDFGPYDE